MHLICMQEEGVVFQLSTTSHTFWVTLTLVSGDNLGSHYVGGYKQLASTLRKCRYCMAVTEDIQQKVITKLTITTAHNNYC